MDKTVKLVLRHLDQSVSSTVSALMDPDGNRLCYIIEDGHREKKVWGKTRIGPGLYEIFQRRDGDFFDLYSKKYGHTFVPQLLNVPSFIGILLHIGNWIHNTAGCLLPNLRYYKDGHDYAGADSEKAYLALYEYLDGLFKDGNRVFIEISRGHVQPSPETEPERDEPAPEPVAPPEPPPVTPEEPATQEHAPNPGCLVLLPLIGLCACLLFFYFGY